MSLCLSVRRTCLSVFLLVFASTAGCSDATSPDTSGITFQHSFSDPVADTTSPGTNVFARALDVHAVRVGLTDDSLFVRFEFTTPIDWWSVVTQRSIDGFVDFDIDASAASGVPAAVNEFGGGDAQMGVEYYVSLRDNPLRQVLVRDVAQQTWSPIGITLEEKAFTLRIRRSDIGETDGIFTMSATIAGLGRMATDFVPNQGHFVIGS